MNIFPTKEYDVPPEEIDKKSLESEEDKLDYDFKRLKKVEKHAARYSRYDVKRDKKSKKEIKKSVKSRRGCLHTFG